MRIILRINSRAIYTCLIMVYLTNSFIFQTASIANSELVVSGPNPFVKDLGQVPADKNSIRVEFPWVNKSSETLEILKVIRSCGCAEVKPTEGRIKPGEKVEFVADIDGSDWSGNAAFGFAVFFKNKMDSPIRFKVNFYKPKTLEPVPKHLDFGYVDDPLKSFKTFKITWVFDLDDMGLQILPNIFSDRGLASCHLLEKKKKKIRLPNADKPTDQQEFVFETFLKPQLPRGEFNDIIRIPVVLNGKIENVAVSVVGQVRGKLFSSPSKVYSLIPHDKIKETEIKVTLLTAKDLLVRPSYLNVTCDDSRLSVALTKPKADTKLVGTISIIVQNPIRSHIIDTKLNIIYKIGDKKENFDIPVKIVIINGTENGN